MQGGREDHAGGEPAENEKAASRGSTSSWASQQEDGAEGQPGNVHDGAKCEKETEGDGAPSVTFCPPQRQGGDHKEAHGDRPSQLMGATTAKPAVKCAETECQSDDGGGGGQSRVQGHAGQG